MQFLTFYGGRSDLRRPTVQGRSRRQGAAAVEYNRQQSADAQRILGRATNVLAANEIFLQPYFS